jgi:hypothetical protein
LDTAAHRPDKRKLLRVAAMEDAVQLHSRLNGQMQARGPRWYARLPPSGSYSWFMPETFAGMTRSFLKIQIASQIVCATKRRFVIN